ncbi:MAG: type II secretion system secretin GspD [Gammaproteobacteria bacterium]|nr:type II secretion system secretin GspD [Gammaproteobacteria bacterium]
MIIRLPVHTLFIALLLLALPLRANELTLNLKDADIRAVIATVSEMTGKNFIIDPRVKGTVTVISSAPMQADEVYEVFLSLLNVYGYTAVEGDNVVKIVPDANAKQSPVPTDSAERPERGDGFVTRILPIQNVNAAQLVPILRPLLPQQAHLAAYPATNVLIISDVADNVSRIADLVQRIDRESESEIELVALKYASADEVASILSTLASEDKKKGGEGGVTSQVAVLADSRTNSLIIKGEKSERTQVVNIVKKLDVPTGAIGNTRVVYLNYADATELAKVLSGVGESVVSQDAKAQAPNKRNTSVNGQSVSIQADATTNSLVINAPIEVMKELEAVIRQLDIRRAQVMVKAVIAEISSDKSAEFGVNWGYDGSGDRSPIGIVDFNGAISTLAKGALTGDITQVPPGLSLGIGDLRSGGSRFIALVQALRGDSDTNILSTPSLVTLDNEEAEIIVGQNVPFVTGSYSSASGTSAPTNPFQTISREDVGISLKIKPQINEGNSIRMEIEQEVSSVSTASTGAADLITNKRSLKSTVMVDDGDILALGGLLDENYSENNQKVPGLGDIPILGWLFSYKKNTKAKQDLTIFLHPRIIRNSKEGSAITSRKYGLLRSDQLRQLQESNHLLGESKPTLPPLPDFLELPLPFEVLYGSEEAADIQPLSATLPVMGSEP